MAKKNATWELSKEQKEQYMRLLIDAMPRLRAAIGVSQGDLSKVVGIARQTISSLETGFRKMSWGMYLSLLIFFDSNEATHKIIRQEGIFPEELRTAFNGGKRPDICDGIPGIPEEITDKLDKEAYRAIRTVIMLEYARCADITGDTIVRSFDGIGFRAPEKNEALDNAVAAVKKSRKGK